MDVYDKKTRSAVMSRVRSKRNKSTELELIKIFKQNGIKGWRRNYKLQGKPDFVFPKLRVVFFADGCFWHGHNCRNTKPKTNAVYWKQKIARNRMRDKSINRQLSKNGWRVFRIWECAIAKNKLPKSFLRLTIFKGG